MTSATSYASSGRSTHLAAPLNTRSEKKAMDILKETCCRVDSGYELGLLWEANRLPLIDNYSTALKRLKSIKRRLQRYPRLAEGYGKALTHAFKRVSLTNCPMGAPSGRRALVSTPSPSYFAS